MLAFKIIQRHFCALKKSKVPEVSSKCIDKLNALTDVISTLPRSELEYLNELLIARKVEKGTSIISCRLFSSNDDSVTPLQYVYQNKWVQSNWKETHMLTLLDNKDTMDLGAEVEEKVVKEIYDVELVSVDPNQKIKVIKVLRELLGLGLKEAKEASQKVPAVIKQCKKDQADKLRDELMKMGCNVVVK